MSAAPDEMVAGKQHHMLLGEVEYERAIDQVIALAQSTLHIFDANLANGGYASLTRYEALREFLGKKPDNRLVFVLHEVDYFSTRCPRLMNLLRMYSHKISVHQTHEHARIASDPFVVADEMHYVHRFHFQGARFLLAFQDPAGAHELQERFAQLLEASHPAVSATTLGL